ncbi:hypothetical protein [Magnetospirillum sulfuroxidans]|uniref:Uncharacterized protein n=1 Tax=Magnetospirillum sulfuroxidans TaxID=611300 RepID=A0ABS5IBN1_9PROT|nr:hypothetical protein [Magnetospirillum sulfuroxidans]MBR9971833.1 hypothetical protein [Magnetospirillum sulfuroxidans]
MADDLRIGASTAGLDSLKQALGLGGGSREVPMAGAAVSTGTRGGIGGKPGNRVLPADFPLDQLDRMARRGTYVDILV